MLEFTFLTSEQCFDENKRLEFFNKLDIRASNTDFTTLLCQKSSKYSSWWLQTSNSDNNEPQAVNENGAKFHMHMYFRNLGARPAIEYSLIKDKALEPRKSLDGVLSISYGEYPQNLTSDFFSVILEQEFQNNTLNTTGKIYNIPSLPENLNAKNFKTHELIEYEYDGKKFVRFLCKNINSKFRLRNEIVKKGDYYWIEVSPVRWLIDKKNNIALTDKIIFGGFPYYRRSKYFGDFHNTDAYLYMKKHFSKDIIPSHIIINKDKKNQKNIESQNAYEFTYENVTDEDLIRGSLESNITPFLHGRSSEGKSARIKQFDPDAEIVYLRNATPDSLNGKSVYNAEKNEMIDVPPTWYVKLKEKCEKEPDKLHIVFFDELTNALPSIQGMAFNIILDKEINGKWKLPENARVAAAGNDLEDSLAANTMAEPLFNRFNHVYINTTVESWLSWALTPNNSYERLDYKKQDTTKQFKIHPAIYAYIASKKEAVLRTKYTGVKPNADPRKWEMASKVLYQTNNPYMLRGLIGDVLTVDFVAFCKTKVITLQDVISGNYDNKIFEINSAEKYLTTLALSNVDEENIEVVRNFIEKLGEEFLALFDSLWTIGDDERLERLMNLKQGKVKKISI